MATTAPFFFSNNQSDEQLLTQALRGEEAAWTHLTRRFRPYLAVVVRRRTPSLPPDLQFEVAAEVWAAVFLRGADAYHRDGESARHYVASFLKGATDRVRAAYRAPGHRARARDAHRLRKRPDPRGGRRDLTIVSLELLQEDHQPQAEDEVEQLDRSIDIDRAQAVATPDVAMAIEIIRFWDVGFEEAARMVGLTRATLRRRLAQVGQRLHAA
ncbi:MAG TPA: hypothetical protein VIV88_17670 [Gemmatimonadales bacterium]|jgi:DNA-directed RNA polymerase specialized sigma24 family protein